MILAESIATLVTHPHVKAEICEIKRHRISTIHTDPSGGVKETMLVQHHWLRFITFLYSGVRILLSCGPSRSANSKGAVDVVVLRGIIMTLHGVALVSDNHHKVLVSVFSPDALAGRVFHLFLIIAVFDIH